MDKTGFKAARGLTLKAAGSAAVLAITLLSTGAQAQDSSSGAEQATQRGGFAGDGEIVVTATRRDMTTQEIPLAIDVVKGDSIESAAAFSFESFARLNPALQVNNRGVGDNQIVLRGISSAGKPTVGLYYDEVIITGLGLDGGSDNQPNIQLHDIERVEVLKGPQGTLFGASSMSGTVRAIANKPNLGEVRGGVTASVAAGSKSNTFYQGEAFVDLPVVTDKVGIRTVVWGDTGGGYIDRVGTRPGSNVNDQEVWGGRSILLIKPSDAVTLTLTALHQETQADGSQYFELDQGAYNATSPTIETFEDNIDLYSAVADFDVGIGTFTATTSYFDRRMLARRDSTPTARRFNLPGDLAYVEGQKLTNWTSELRFASDLSGPLQFVLGGFYSQQRVDGHSAALVADPLTGIPRCIDARDCRAQGFGRDDVNSGYGSVDTNQYALFGEVNYELMAGLKATVGARYYNANIREKTIQSQALRHPVFGAVQTEEIVTIDTDETEDKVSYNFALAYEVTPTTSLYARVASGFRPGGANNAAGARDQGITGVPDQFTADTLWNYEIGAKTYLLDRMLYLELAYYHIDWSKQQISITDPGGTFVYVANAGRSRVNGVELQLNARPTDGLTMNFGVTYTDSTLAEDLPATADVAGKKGDTLPYSPKWAFAGSFNYEAPLSDRAVGYLGANMNYRAKSATGFNVTDPNYLRIDDYFLMSARVGARVDAFDLSLFVDNVFDSVPQIGMRVSGDGYRVYTTRPRTFGVKASLRY